jgi:hypothetical protein
MKIRDRFLKILRENGQQSMSELSSSLKISRQYLHRIVIDLEEQELIKKVGTPPRVYYSINETSAKTETPHISREEELFLNQHFLLIDPLGKRLKGIEAMRYWCDKQNLEVSKTTNEFIETRKKYLEFLNPNGLIDGLPKLKNTAGLNSIGLDHLYYLDFYAIERFGKTPLGTLMHYAKQGQNKVMMKEISDEIQQRILNLIADLEIDAVAFVPPTIPRKTQIMTELQKYLKTGKPLFKVEKIKTPITIPQKALSKLYERVANAKNTFAIPVQMPVNRLLLIDDAVGSGATMNEIALKIKQKGLSNAVFGVAITGSYKGFEVISEL